MTDQPMPDTSQTAPAEPPAPDPAQVTEPPAPAYEFTRPDLPEGLTYDEGLEASFRETAAQLNLTPEQAQGLVDAFGAYQAQSFTGAMGSAAETGRSLEAELQAEWGADYARNLDSARRAAKSLAGDDETLAQLTDAMGEAGVVRFFHKLGGLMVEDTLTGSGDGTFGLSPGGALTEVSRIEGELRELLPRQDGAAQAERQKLETRRRALLAKAYPDG